MKGRKVYHIKTNHDELLYIKNGLKYHKIALDKDGNHDSAQRVQLILNKLELIMRRI